MAFNYYSVKLIFRCLLSFGLGILLVKLVSVPGYHTITLVCALITALAIFELLRFITQGQQRLLRLLEAFECGDFSQHIKTEYQDPHLKKIAYSLQRIQQRFAKQQQQQQTKLSYFQAVVDQVPVPLVCLHQNHRVELLNARARQIFSGCHLTQLPHFRQFGELLPGQIAQLGIGQTALLSFNFDSGEKQLAVSTTQLINMGEHYRLISLQDIQTQLDSAQLQAWQDLVSVLTHEIINSMTPVASLAGTAADLAQGLLETQLSKALQEPLQDLERAVSTVAKRANNLNQFIAAYRRISRLPEPELKPVVLQTLIERVQRLACQHWPKQQIELRINIEPRHLTLQADEQMLEQVLINLLHNAEQALLDGKRLTREKSAIEKAEEKVEKTVIIEAGVQSNGHLHLSVADNGPGVPEALARQIFVPFFTTKAQGSGVGLALSRQILIQHGGRLIYSKSALGGACFTLVL